MSRPYGTPKTEAERQETHSALYGSRETPPRGSGYGNPSLLNKIATLIGTGLIKFVNLVFLANRDYPLHDFKKFEDTDEPCTYRVGEDNKQGDQKKYFVSKSTMVYADVACTLRWNSANNVVQDIVANTWYTFKCNIRSVHVVTIGANGTLRLYFEGVLPQEVRIGA